MIVKWTRTLHFSVMKYKILHINDLSWHILDFPENPSTQPQKSCGLHRITLTKKHSVCCLKRMAYSRKVAIVNVSFDKLSHMTGESFHDNLLRIRVPKLRLPIRHPVTSRLVNPYSSGGQLWYAQRPGEKTRVHARGDRLLPDARTLCENALLSPVTRCNYADYCWHDISSSTAQPMPCV